MQVTPGIRSDRNTPGPNPLVTALTVVAELAAIFCWTRWTHTHHIAHTGVLPWPALFILAVLIVTAVHESGHAFFAWGCYMKSLSFNAGPLRWHKIDGNWIFKFHPAGFLDLGSPVEAVPTKPKQRIHELWTLFAGPLANILFGAALLWCLFSLGLPYYDQTWRLVALTASFSFIAAVINLLPFGTEDSGYSDGARILQIVTKSPLDYYHRITSSIAAITVSPQRYRDLDVATIERAAGLFPNDLRALNLHLCIANCYLDSGNTPAAQAALASAEAIYTNASIDLPARLHLPFVFDYAYLNRDAATARVWWDRMEAKVPEPANVDYWIAQTALFWIEGRRPEAAESWQKAEDAAQLLPETGSGDWDRERCERLRKELNTPSQISATPAAKPVPAPKPAALIPAPPAPPPPIPAPQVPKPERRAVARPIPIPDLAPALSAVAASVSSQSEVDDHFLLGRIARPTPVAKPAPIAEPDPIPEPEPVLAAEVAPIPEAVPVAEPVLIAEPDLIAQESCLVEESNIADPAQFAETNPVDPAPLEQAPIAASVSIADPDQIADVTDFATEPPTEPIAASPNVAIPILSTTPAADDSTPVIDWAALIAEAAAAEEAAAAAAAAEESEAEAAPEPAWTETPAASPTDAAESDAWAAMTTEAQTFEPPAPEPVFAEPTPTPEPVFTAPPSPPAPPPPPPERPRFDPLKHIREAHQLQEAERLAAAAIVSR